MKLVENIVSNKVVPHMSAAMYYKTEPFYTNTIKYTHTNNWEIVRAVEILTSKGFSVDIIDRDNHSWVPNKQYDLFLGLGAGNSGKNFVRYARSSKARVKVFLAMGPQPDISNELVLQRYRDFHKRTGRYAPPMRTVTEVIGDKFLEIMSETDLIFNIGEKENESYKSYLKYRKPIIHFYPAVSPAVTFDPQWMNTRAINEFLCFAGNGLICKGVDIVTEAFLSDQTKRLSICGPAESAFFEQYGEKIQNSRNVRYYGFVEPGGKVFNELASKCSYVVFHSSAEGCCTSVATAIRAGLVPIINSWTGIIADECGIPIPDGDDNILAIKSCINYASSLSSTEYSHLVHQTLEKSRLFTQKSYTESYTSAIDEVIKRLQ